MNNDKQSHEIYTIYRTEIETIDFYTAWVLDPFTQSCMHVILENAQLYVMLNMILRKPTLVILYCISIGLL